MHKPREVSILNNPGLSYSDIVYGLYNPIFVDIVTPNGLPNYQKINEKWFREDVAMKLMTTRICPIPYLDYKFEYPPIVGALWFVSTCISFTLTFSPTYSSVEYYLLVKKAGDVHYYIQSFFISASLIISIIYMYKLSKTLNKSWSRVALFAVLPSTILYLIYNWDMITAMFILMSIYYLYNKKFFLSGLLLGLSISTKLLPLILAIAVIYDLIQKTFINKEYVHTLSRFALGVVVGLIPYIIMIAISYNGFTYFIQHHAQWYCENCLYLLITKDVWNPYNRVLSMLFIFLALIITMTIDVQYDEMFCLCTISLISLVISTALNYVFSPQMMLMLTSIAVLILNLKQLLFLIVADLANFGIMALFFKDAEARSWLIERLGVRVRIMHNPWDIDSPVQMLATIRNVILILLMVDLIYTLLKLRSKILEK
jgi:uncharacterized membrane protein